MAFNIRKATFSDVGLLTPIALTSKAHWGYSDDFMQACVEELTVSDVKFLADEFSYWVAESDAGLLGFYALEQLSDAEAELEALFVKPESIGTGVGKALFNHAMKVAFLSGYEAVVIQSDPNADDFYSGMGATLVDTQESQSIPGRYLSVFKYKLNDTSASIICV